MLRLSRTAPPWGTSARIARGPVSTVADVAADDIGRQCVGRDVTAHVRINEPHPFHPQQAAKPCMDPMRTCWVAMRAPDTNADDQVDRVPRFTRNEYEIHVVEKPDLADRQVTAVRRHGGAVVIRYADTARSHVADNDLVCGYDKDRPAGVPVVRDLAPIPAASVVQV